MSTDRFTEILNYLSAMSREIGEFRTETGRQFADVYSRLDGLDARMGSLETRLGNLEGRVGNLETEVRTGFEQVRKDIRIMNHKFDEFAIDTMDLRAEQRDLRKRTEVLEKKAGITDSV